MRNIAACYSEHAVKVSDSYCFAYSNRSFFSPRLIPSVRNAIVCTYKVKLYPHKHLLITITWSTKLLCKGFWIKVAEKSDHKSGSNSDSARRIGSDSEKGNEKFGSCGSRFEVYWDLSSAKFDGPGPKPNGSFYVVVLVDSHVGLLLGDMKEDPLVEQLTAGLPIAKSSFVSQYDQISGSTQFSTWARFCDPGQAHEVVIRCGAEVDEEGPVLSVSIDKKRVLKVRRLQWNFRGNHVVFVDGLLVDVMWDVHRWIFSNHQKSTVRDGVFMFRTRSGLDSRLWLEEERLTETENNHDEIEFSFLVCATTSTNLH